MKLLEMVVIHATVIFRNSEASIKTFQNRFTLFLNHRIYLQWMSGGSKLMYYCHSYMPYATVLFLTCT